MQEFALFFMDNLPNFLMASPIKEFIGLIIMSAIVNLILSLKG